jgi:protein ImuB
MMAGLFLCVHAADFPAQALLRLRPELRNKPVAVLEGTAPLERVCACNIAAKKEGIVRGATRVEAETFFGVTLLRRSLIEEQAAADALLDCAGRFSPLVEALQREMEFCCVADIAGTEMLLGTPDKVADGICVAMAALGINVSAAVSHDFHTAVAVAGCGRGTRIVSAGGERDALAPLPLHALPLSIGQAETFELWGIRTVGQLAELPEVELISRMGQDAKRLRQLARGEHTHLFRAIEPEIALRESIEFDEPVELLESLLFMLSAMLGQLISRAASRAQAIASLHVEMRLDGGRTHERTVKPALPSGDQKFLLKLVQLDMAAHPPQAGVRALTMMAAADSSRKIQLGLFAPQMPESSRLDVTLSRLAALVGENRVGSPQLKDSYQPDAFRQTMLALTTNADGGAAAQARPAIRRFRPPVVLRVQVKDRRPVTFSYEAQHYTVTAAYGPWRSSGDWWAASRWARDEWDVLAQAEQQQLYCVLVENPALRQWSIDAVYD